MSDSWDSNNVILEMVEICGGKMNITIVFNVDGVIFKMWIIILATQNVLTVFSFKIWKYDIDICIYWYQWEGY